MSSHSITFEKLKGRENFNVWKRSMKSYLVIKGLWKFTQSALTSSSTEADKESDLKCLSEMILLIDPMLFSYIDEKPTAKEAWDALENSLSEKGSGRSVALLKKFTHYQLNDFDCMEHYVTEMLTMSARVKNSGLPLDDQVIATVMLAGLPSDLDAFVITIENTQAKLTIDFVKTTLLQDV